MNRKRWITGALAGCLAGLLAGCSLLPAEEEVAPAIIPAQEVTYNTVEAERGTISKVVNKSGSLRSVQQHNLSFQKRGGYISEILVRSGARVAVGDILASMETEELEQQVAEQQVAARIAQINYNEALNAANQDTEQPAVQRARANLDLAWMKLNNLNEEFEAAVIRSPIDGVITYAAALRVGDFVEARNTVFTVADDTQLVVMVFGDAGELSDLGLDMEVGIRYKREDYRGVVTVTPSNAPVDAFYSGEPFVQIEFTDMPEDIIIGQTVQVSFSTASSEDTVIVPANAVTQYGSYSYVRVLEDGVSRERPVELGITTSTQIEIKEGLQPGELVVVR